MKKLYTITRKVFSNTFLLFNLAAVLWLLFCYIASIKDPIELRFIALFSLTTPFALLVNFFFVGLWLFSRIKWRALISLTALLLSFNMIQAVFGYHFFTKNEWAKSSTSSFKLMSWNTHAMGIYNVSTEKAIAKDIVSLINQESPDILCLPEFSINSNPAKNKNLRKIINDNNYLEYRINTDHILNDKVVIGTAVLSKYPLVNYKVYDLNPEIYLVQLDVALPNKAIISVFVTHLHSFNLSDEDKFYIERLKRNNETIKKSKPFFTRFNNSYVSRGDEANQIRTILDKAPHPIIICGDFNDLPYSYTYRKIKGTLTDAFTIKGRGFGRTYNQIIPTLRIDYIFYSQKHFNLKAFQTMKTHLSDHNPIIAHFDLAQPAKNHD